MLNKFLREEYGAQVIEYALIIAVIAIAWLVALQTLFTTGSPTFLDRLSVCLTTGACS